MRNSPWKTFTVAAAIALTAASAAAQTAAEQFAIATREYALTHRRIEQMLGPLVVTASPDDLLSNINAMGAAIRMERAHARQGDFFTPAMADELRRRIAAALEAGGLTPADLVTDEIPEGVDRRSLVLRVGGAFPWVAGFSMAPCVLAALPPLPPELQYRFVFRDLVLVDVHANVVVDILPYALAATEF